MFRTDALKSREEASERDLDTRQTPEQTGELSIETTVFITTGESGSALLLPTMSGGMFDLMLEIVQ